MMTNHIPLHFKVAPLFQTYESCRIRYPGIILASTPLDDLGRSVTDRPPTPSMRYSLSNIARVYPANERACIIYFLESLESGLYLRPAREEAKARLYT